MLKYDPETGEFFWRVRARDDVLRQLAKDGNGHDPLIHACNQWNSRWAGKPAMSLKADGYHYTHFNYRTLLAHRACVEDYDWR